ncbi:MAG: hypothetical protein Q9227_004326 [Pyrenula ochraceoflavens]
MADPFEVRLRFTSALRNLTASSTSAQKAALYALKHRDLDEDLHSCILEQLDRNNMNNRANIMYFLEPFCELAQREGAASFVEMVRRDIGRIVDAVAPEGAGGGANGKVVRRVLEGLGGRGVLGEEVVGEMEGRLREREARAGEMRGGMDDVMGDNATTEDGGGAGGGTGGPGGGEDEVMLDRDGEVSPKAVVNDATAVAGGGEKRNGLLRVNKKVIEQRIEEDRERNKRLRESMWAVGAEDDEEYEKMWDELSDINEDDLRMAKEEAEERAQCAKFDSTA